MGSDCGVFAQDFEWPAALGGKPSVQSVNGDACPENARACVVTEEPTCIVILK